MRPLAALLLLVFSALVIAGAPVAKGDQPQPVRPSLPATARGHAPHPIMQSTGLPQIQPPSEQEILNLLAVQIPQPPGQLYVEPQEQYPPGQSGLRTLGHSITRPVSRMMPRRRNPSLGPNIINTSGNNFTGINHWWTYEEDGIGGVGKYMVNVANGNLLLQADDMAITHRGVELAFHRTYNSFSQHDYADTDGSTINNFGDGWTNTFDAHIAYNTLSGGNGVSVFDIDGARYDYSQVCNPTCVYVPPPGQFATLTFNASYDRFYWTKKNGTEYKFHDPNDPTTGVAGRVQRIWARNNNTWLQFNYYFNTGYTDPAHLTKIQVTPESIGQVPSFQAKLLFSDFTMSDNSTRRLLSSVVWPDNTTVTYKYSTSGYLTEVDEPSNNSAGTVLPQWYTYATGHLVQTVSSSRWAVSNGADGEYLSFGYTGSAAIDAQYYAFANPSVPDPAASSGTSAVQSSYSSTYGTQPNQPYRFVSFPQPGTAIPSPLPTASPSGSATCPTSSSATYWYDTDGHETVYCFDGSGRVVQNDDWTGSRYLVYQATWDSNNDLTASIDPRSNETDYAYDSNGNGIAVGGPQVTTSAGTFRPTSMYVYDSNNNITAYCDPVFVGSRGYQQGSNTPPSTSICTPQAGVTSYTWTVQTYEPYGELTMITTAGNAAAPNGYHYTFAYPSGTSDFGQPLTVTGDTFNQSDTNFPTITPTQTFVYDTVGNPVCYNSGYGWTVRQFDPDNRITAEADADDNGVPVSRSACPANPSPGPTATTAVYRSYFADGEVQQTQNSAQMAHSTEDTFTYDADGDVLTTTTWTGGVQSTKNTWYDGIGRLVQVQEPNDSRTWTTASPGPPTSYPTTIPYDSSAPLFTRYYYDLSKNSTVSFGGGTPYSAHGDLFKTVAYLPSGSTYTWQDVKGNAYDSLDRSISGYYYSPGNSTIQTSSATYDGAGYLGLENQSCNGASECENTTFDALSRALQISFTGGSGEPSRTYTYDPDGRTASVQSSIFGTQSYTFDAEGHIVTSTEPNQGGVTSPAMLTYDYYANGWKQDLQVSASAWTQSTPAFQYFYRPDGKLERERFNHLSDAARDFSWTYTPAGRLLSNNDPYLSSPNSYAYDAFGRTQSYGLGSGRQYTSIGYDDEGETTQYTASTLPLMTVFHQYNVRGELAAYYNTNASFRAASDYGVMLNYQYSCTNDSPPVCKYGALGTTVDYKEGVETYAGIFGEANTTWSYDAAGRQASATGYQAAVGVKLNTVYVPGSFVRYYDIENHLTKTSYTSWNTNYDYVCTPDLPPTLNAFAGLTVRYKWGPNGHPIMVGSTNFGTPLTDTTYTVPSTPPPDSTITSDTLHWDGDSLLFTTNSSGQLDDIKIGTIADFTFDSSFTGLTVWDRDQSGTVVSSHYGTTSYAAWSANDPFERPCKSAGQTFASGYPGDTNFAGTVVNGGTPSLVGRGGLLNEGRSDGISDFYNTIEGVRSYDSQQTAWTTPDAYAGDVHDPMSQKPYMWNRNNPTYFSDPTGFDALLDITPNAVGNLGHEQIIIYNDKTLKGTRWSVQSGNGRAMHAPLSVTSTPVDVNSLPTRGHEYFKVLSSRADDANMNQYASKVQASESSHKYNFCTNNCAQFVNHVLHSCETSSCAAAAGATGLEPRFNLLFLEAAGFTQVNPGSIQAAPPAPTHTGPTVPQ